MNSKDGQQTLLIFIAVLSIVYLVANLIKCCTKNRNRVRNAVQNTQETRRTPPELPQVRRTQFIKQQPQQLNEDSEGFNTIPKEWRNLQ